jgi:hypothetical protein
MARKEKSGSSLQRPTKRHVFIAVMSITGSGKTSFIKDATGYAGLKVGDDLNGCESLRSVKITVG